MRPVLPPISDGSRRPRLHPRRPGVSLVPPLPAVCPARPFVLEPGDLVVNPDSTFHEPDPTLCSAEPFVFTAHPFVSRPHPSVTTSTEPSSALGCPSTSLPVLSRPCIPPPRRLDVHIFAPRSRPRPEYLFFATIETVCTVAIVWQAWTWSGADGAVAPTFIVGQGAPLAQRTPCIVN